MPDEDDYKHALSGASDLVGCVLDGADFSGLELAGRYFQSSNLSNATLVGSKLNDANFSGAKLFKTNFSGANLTGAIFKGSIFKVDFENANLEGATLSGVLTGCNFRGANISGANFKGMTLKEGCVFDGVIHSKETDFSGAKSIRSYSKLPFLDDYDLARGVLVRKPEAVVRSSLNDIERTAILTIDETLRQLRNVEKSKGPVSQETPAIGHNNPPDEFFIDQDEATEVETTLIEARATIESGKKDKATISRAIEASKKFAIRALSWVGRHADNAANEFSKEIGKSLASKTVISIGALSLSGQFEKVIAALSKVLGL